MSIEAMKLAREIIQDYVDDYGSHGKDSGVAYTVMKLDQAIEQAQKQEPVGEVELIDIDDEGTASAWFTIATEMLNLGDKLYTSPPPRQPLTDEQIFEISNGFALFMFPVETRVTDRELAFAKAIEEAVNKQPRIIPLTDDEMWKLWNAQGDDFMEQQAAIAFARAIEAAHGITGEKK